MSFTRVRASRAQDREERTESSSEASSRTLSSPLGPDVTCKHDVTCTPDVTCKQQPSPPAHEVRL